MTDNQIVAKYAGHEDLGSKLDEFVQEITRTTGFVRDGEVQRRTIYDADKVWRVRIRGMLEGKPALLRLENLKLEKDEESIRQAFREQTKGSRVRSPETYLTQPFDETKGYAFSVDEDVQGHPLFDPAGSPEIAANIFAEFYRELRSAVTKPFWENTSGDIRQFSLSRLGSWVKTSADRGTILSDETKIMVARLREKIFASFSDAPLRFQHAHLSGGDVRVNGKEKFIVFANHFWSWRQPGYDVAFPLWNQWMSLPVDRRTSEEVKNITETWLTMIEKQLSDVIAIDDVRLMLLNRLYGSLLLDIPAKLTQAQETKETVGELEQACIAEAKRLLEVT